MEQGEGQPAEVISADVASACAGARVARTMSTGAEKELKELLTELHRVRTALGQYQADGNSEMVTAMRQQLRLQHTLIRRHCEEHGLSLPMDVSARD